MQFLITRISGRGSCYLFPISKVNFIEKNLLVSNEIHSYILELFMSNTSKKSFTYVSHVLAKYCTSFLSSLSNQLINLQGRETIDNSSLSHFVVHKSSLKSENILGQVMSDKYSYILSMVIEFFRNKSTKVFPSLWIVYTKHEKQNFHTFIKNISFYKLF